MTETYSNSYLKITNGGAKNPLSYVRAIRDAFQHGADLTTPIKRWEVENWDETNGILLLKCLKANTNLDSTASPVYSQVVIKAQSTTNIQIGLDPLGQIESSMDSSTWGVSNQSNLFSGFKNITGSTNNMIAGTSLKGAILLAEYEDAFTILIQNAAATAFYYIAHVGKVYLPTNKSDIEIGVDGFGLLVGNPVTNSFSATNGYWLAPPATNLIHGSVIKISNTPGSCWSLVQSAAPNANTVKDILGKSRLVPYYLRGLAPGAGEVGSSKYFRVFKTKLTNFTYVNSATNDSKQSWISCSNPVSTIATQDLLLLWSKYENLYSI
jgi:hypothetical protein